MKYTNIENEAVFSVLPTTKDERKYGFWDCLFVTVSYVIATWCYTQGAFMAEGVSFWQLFATVMAPNIIIIGLASLFAILAARYGIDFWVWVRTIFGNIGYKIVCLFVLFMILPWFAVNSGMFKDALVIMGMFQL